MLDFKKLTLEDIDIIRPYFKFSDSRICDDSAGTLVMWREYFDTHFALHDNTLILRMRSFDGKIVFSMPLGENSSGALSEMENYCNASDIPLVLGTVTENELNNIISPRFVYEISHDEDWDDYLYKAEDLRNMEGRKYSGQRNHINYFINNNPGWYFEKINSTNLHRVLDFHEKLVISSENDMLIKERAMVSEVLCNYEKYAMDGGFISLSDGTVVAMAIGERVGDTLFEHIEKARADVRGAYQLIAREFARNFSDSSTEYINREEDLGLDGLRKSKLSYHPCEKIKKYTVIVK